MSRTELTVCAECREMQRTGSHMLAVLAHDSCRDAIRAELRATRRFGVRFHPSGCAVGSTWAGQFDTCDKVHKQFTDTAKERARERAEGWRHEVLTHDEWDERAQPCLLGKCSHEKAGRGE